MQFVWRLLIVAAMASSVVITGFSCSKKTTKYEPVEYRLYTGAGRLSGGGHVFVIDAETDSVIDSVDYGQSFIRVDASPDGKYLAVIGGGPCLRIYDPQELTIIHEFDCHLIPAFVPGASCIVGVETAGMKFFDYQTFGLLGQDTLLIGFAQTLPGRNVLYGIVPYGGTRTDSTGFVAYNCKERKIGKLWHRLSRPDGGSYRVIYNHHLHPDGRRVYGIAMVEAIPTTRFFCYDLDSDSAIFDLPMYAPYGGVRVTPDGKEVYLTDPGGLVWDKGPGKIFIHDADNGTLLDEISLYDLDTTSSSSHPLYAYNIRFHPEKPKAYVGCGNILKKSGPIIVIDTRKREVIKLIFQGTGRFPTFIDIAPKH